MSILDSILIDLYLFTIRGIARNYRNGAQMQQDCVTTGETMYGCTSASLCSSNNHMSLADQLVMVGPGKLMVGHRP